MDISGLITWLSTGVHLGLTILALAIAAIVLGVVIYQILRLRQK